MSAMRTEPSAGHSRLNDDLARMANQIAAQFHHLGEPEAVAALVGHLRSFWEPRMHEALLHLCEADHTRLHPLVLAAAPHLTPRPGPAGGAGS